MPSHTDLTRITAAHGVTVAQLRATYGHRPETLRRWASEQPATLIALISAMKAGAVAVPLVATIGQSEVSKIKRRAAQARYYQRNRPRLTRARASARRDQWQKAHDAHLAEVARLLAWGAPARAWDAGKLAGAARRIREAGGLVSAADVRDVLAGQGWRCAYCGHPQGLQVRRVDYQAEPDQGNLIGLCTYHAQDRGTTHDQDYRKAHGIARYTKWDGV